MEKGFNYKFPGEILKKKKKKARRRRSKNIELSEATLEKKVPL